MNKKHLCILVVILLLGIAFVGCSPVNSGAVYNSCPPALFWNGTTYYYTGKEVDEAPSNADILGDITATVSRSQMPKNHAEANIAFEGAAVARYGDELAVYMNDAWILFELWGEENAPPALFWDGQIYYWTGEEAEEIPSDGDILGRLTSNIHTSHIPSKHGETNMGIAGASVARYGDKLAVKIHDVWFLFELRED